MTGTPATAATALMLSVAQIIEGSADCSFCEREAVATVMTGADPEPEAVCRDHALNFMDSTRQFVSDVLGGSAPPDRFS